MTPDKNVGPVHTVLTDKPSEMVRRIIGMCDPSADETGDGANRSIVQRKKRILVVEPDDLILGLLKRWLGEAGYAVVVETGALPQPCYEGEVPDLLIIDVPSPRSAGTIMKSVREAYAGPLLLLSARFRRGAGASSDVARQLGARKVLPTPFTRSELLAAVEDSIDDT